jgi:hypothetical protein
MSNITPFHGYAFDSAPAPFMLSSTGLSLMKLMLMSWRAVKISLIPLQARPITKVLTYGARRHLQMV